jgi:RNA polymerase sigma-70 factor (ECF subfamily)
VEVADALADARRAYPELAVDPARFAAAIEARGGGALHTNDLYLACACADELTGAAEAFERACGSVIARAVTAAGASPAEAADLGQVVRQRLLVAPASGGPPRIATYSARGSLAAWVRVVATRETARLLPVARRELAAGDDELAGLIATDDSPELGYIKRLYRSEFKLAFAAAVEALEDRERLLLRQHALDGLGIDQLSALHGVHRATAARWLEAAREAVLAGTQKELVARLGISRTELASIVRLIRSQLDVSLPRLLRR